VSLLSSLRLDGLLSFAPGSAAIPLTPLNLLIGPNGAGKSNLIEAMELLQAIPSGLAPRLREGGGVGEWLWKGDGGDGVATLDATLEGQAIPHGLRYRLSLAAAGPRAEVTDEVIEEVRPRRDDAPDLFFYYRFQSGHPVIQVRPHQAGPPSEQGATTRRLDRQGLLPDESVLYQRRDPDLYPELTWLARQFGAIQSFRDWGFGRYHPLRQPQSAGLAYDRLAPDSANLALILNRLEHSDAGAEMDRLLSAFLPRYRRFSTLVQGGMVQLFLHESGLKAPVPATRLSDGTLRFLAMLALLLSPESPPLLCLEEPELGLHPDALPLLANLLVEASGRCQLVVTTHSDTLVSALTEQTESVLVCEHQGGTRLRRLESERLRHWLERYRLGEIWRIGELGGNP
jgi:predicted ATPase